MLEKIKDILCRRTAASDRSEATGNLLNQMSANECDLKRADGGDQVAITGVENRKRDDKKIPNTLNGITQKDINSVLLFPSDKRKIGLAANQIQKESKSNGDRSPSHDRTEKQTAGRF